jgi:phosphohistidine phosphatase
MRHAKSDWDNQGTPDFERPLNKRGVKNAKRIGQWMLDNNRLPQQIYSSQAVRAKQTTQLVIGELLEISTESIHYNKDLYLADVDTLIEFIQLYKTNANSLMLVAHNPGLEQLVHFLSNKPEMVFQSMTTANLVIFEFPDSNFDPEIDKGEIVEFIKPKELD